MLGKFKRGTKNVQRNQKCLKKTIRGKTWKKQIENNNRLNLSILIVTLNLNSLNTPIKKHRQLDQIKKDPNICCLQEASKLG